MKFHIQLPILMALLCLNQTPFAAEKGQPCAAISGDITEQSQHLLSKVDICISTKNSELGRFLNKRQQYLNLLDWAEHYNGQLWGNAYSKALKERDVLLTTKLAHFEECVTKLEPPKKPALDDQSESMCSNSLVVLKTTAAQCQQCSIVRIGSGYERSPVQIMVEQHKDSRRLREVLFNIARQGSTDIDSLNQQQKWRLMRDVVLHHVEDIADEQTVSSRVLQLLEWLGERSDLQDNYNAATDAQLAVYTALANVIKSDKGEVNRRAVELQKDLSLVVVSAPNDFTDPTIANKYAALDSEQLVQLFAPLNDDQRKILTQNIDTATKLYGLWK